MGFSFEELWEALKNDPSSIADYGFCVRHVGKNYQSYPFRDIYERVALWKLPLIQLVSQFLRPPLGFRAQTFVILHLLGDPVDTIYSLLYHLKKVQGYANSFGDTAEGRALALIASSYDEWDKGEEVKNILLDLQVFGLAEAGMSGKTMEACLKAAGSLAADRATAFIPVLTSELIFILGLYLSLIKCTSNPDNRTSYNIAFAALYFWVIPAVLLSALVGVSQSEDAIPRILEQFEGDLSTAHNHRSISLPKIYSLARSRLHSGGIYTWQHNKYRIVEHGPSKVFLVCSALSSCLAVCTGFGIAFSLSWTTPPEGLGCRGLAQLSFLSIWMLSWLLDWILARIVTSRNDGLLLWSVMFKDVMITTGTLTTAIFSTIGVWNKCFCWTNLGTSLLRFPQDEAVSALLKGRVQRQWIFLMSLGIGLELILLLIFSIFLWGGLRVLLQTDKQKGRLSKKEK